MALPAVAAMTLPENLTDKRNAFNRALSYDPDFRERFPDGLLTTRQVADYLGVSPSTVLRRWRAGELPGFRLASNCLRFDPDEIAAWLAERRH
jgi:excisionase family DNA binding protein